MAGKISVECPSCLAKLNISDPGKLGKKLKCPKCQEVFTPEAAADDEDDDLMDDYDDESERKPKLAPIQRRGGGGGASKGGAKSSSARSSEGGGSNGLLIGGIAAAAVLLLGGFGLIASGVFSSSAPPINPNPTPAQPSAAAPVNPSPSPSASPASPATPSTPVVSTIPAPSNPAPASTPKPAAATADPEKILALRWMPQNTDLLIHIKPAAIVRAPLAKKLIELSGLTTTIDEQSKQLGAAASEIESLTIGFPDFVGSIFRIVAKQQQAMSKRTPLGQMPNPAKEVRYVMVLKVNQSLTLEDATKSLPNIKMQSEDGKNYFMGSTTSSIPEYVGGWLPDPKTFIMATEQELKDTLQKGDTFTPNKEFLTLDPKPHLLIAGLSRELTSEEIQIVQSGSKDPAMALLSAKLAEKSPLQMYSIGLSVRGGFDLNVSAAFDTPENANKFKADTEKQRDDAKVGFQTSKKLLPPLIGDLGELLFENLRIQGQDRTVKIAISLPDSAQAKLEQLPSLLMVMASSMQGAGGFPMLGFNPLGSTSPAADPSKQPGETEPVQPSSVEGLPEGFSIVARSAWSSEPALLVDGSSALTMELLVDVTGDRLEKVCAATVINGKTIKLDSGAKFRLAKVLQVTGIDPLKTPVPFDVDDATDTTHPPQTLRVRLIGDAPSATSTATRVESFEGSFKILVAQESKEYTIEDATKIARRPLTDPEFKAAELNLRRSLSDVTPPTLTLWAGKDHFVGLVKGSPDDYFSVTEIDKDRIVQRMYANETAAKFPDDFQLTFKLYSKVEEHTVSFKFENIPLPDKNARP